MMQLWYDDMIRFMKDASEYGSYHQELADILAPHLNKEMRVCDAGCGLGYLSLALSPYVGQVTGVEKHPKASAVLAENCRRLGVTNVTALCGEIAQTAPDTKYDAMVFCFFGGIHEILAAAREQCRGKVFIITRNYTTHRFSVGQHPTGSYGRMTSREGLMQLGIPYDEQILDIEFGQPFRSLGDARRFFELYSQDQDASAITNEFLWSRLVTLEHERFPLYMPHRRSLAILRFEASEIPVVTDEHTFYTSCIK